MSFTGSIENIDKTRHTITDRCTVMLSIFDVNFNAVHVHFATPYEAWRWADGLAKSLAEKITAEQVTTIGGLK